MDFMGGKIGLNWKQDKGRGQRQKNVFFRALPESPKGSVQIIKMEI